MTLTSTREQVLDFLNVMGPQASLGLLIAGLFFIYLAIKNDHDRTWFAVYAVTAVGVLFAAVFLNAMPQIDIDYALAFLGLR